MGLLGMGGSVKKIKGGSAKGSQQRLTKGRINEKDYEERSVSAASSRHTAITRSEFGGSIAGSKQSGGKGPGSRAPSKAPSKTPSGRSILSRMFGSSSKNNSSSSRNPSGSIHRRNHADTQGTLAIEDIPENVEDDDISDDNDRRRRHFDERDLDLSDDDTLSPPGSPRKGGGGPPPLQKAKGKGFFGRSKKTKAPRRAPHPNAEAIAMEQDLTNVEEVRASDRLPPVVGKFDADPMSYGLFSKHKIIINEEGFDGEWWKDKWDPSMSREGQQQKGEGVGVDNAEDLVEKENDEVIQQMISRAKSTTAMKEKKSKETRKSLFFNKSKAAKASSGQKRVSIAEGSTSGTGPLTAAEQVAHAKAEQADNEARLQGAREEAQAELERQHNAEAEYERALANGQIREGEPLPSAAPEAEAEAKPKLTKKEEAIAKQTAEDLEARKRRTLQRYEMDPESYRLTPSGTLYRVHSQKPKNEKKFQNWWE